MSWQLSVTATPKDGVDAVIEAAKPYGEEPSPALDADVRAAKDALKLLAPFVKRGLVSGSASGHCLQPSEGNSTADFISVSVWGIVEL